MKCYIAVSGTIFALLVVMHIWRASVEGAGILKQPFFIIPTVLAAGMAIWAWRVYRKLPKG